MSEPAPTPDRRVPFWRRPRRISRQIAGTLVATALVAVALFGALNYVAADRLLRAGGFEQLAVQGLMVLVIIAWVSVASLIVFGALKATIGLRVNEEEEVEGLDVPEHGMAGYSNDPSYA